MYRVLHKVLLVSSFLSLFSRSQCACDERYPLSTLSMSYSLSAMLDVEPCDWNRGSSISPTLHQ